MEDVQRDAFAVHKKHCKGQATGLIPLTGTRGRGVLLQKLISTSQ